MFIVGLALFVGGYEVGAFLTKKPGADLTKKRGVEDFADTEPQVQDAIHRWALKADESEAKIRREYSPRAMFIPVRNQGSGNMCIQLEPTDAVDVGGSPVFCYQDDTTVLVAEYSDVE